MDPIRKLQERAAQLGASDTRVISPEVIKVEDHFLELCKPPQCDGYDRSANCPPHVMSPVEFRRLLGNYHRALVFKVDCTMDILLDEEQRDDVNRLVQDIAARVEILAMEIGYPEARGLAFGSCKRIFCSGYDYCNVIGAGGPCRNPDRSRPSMSGLGINFNRLNSALGWAASGTGEGSGLGDTSMTMVTGMVLID
jgi:predicted metal-binding protein